MSIEPTSSPRPSPLTWIWLILCAAGWLFAFGGRWLSDQTGIGFGTFGDALARSLVVLAVLASVPLVLHACLRRRWVAAGLVVPVVAGLGIAGGWLSSDQHNITAWYWLHRSDYVAISALADAGSLGTSAIVLGTNNGKPIPYVPVWTGIPDCSAGYAWFSGPVEPRYTAPDAESKDALDDTFGCAVRPLRSVGDGWWFIA